MVGHRKTIMYQELRGKKGLSFDANFCSLLDFLRAQANPFINKPLKSDCTTLLPKKFIVSDEILNVFDNADKVYIYRQERCVLKKKKLAVTICKLNVPKFDTVVDTKTNTAFYTTTLKVLATAQRDFEIARKRGMTLEEVFTHGHFRQPPV